MQRRLMTSLKRTVSLLPLMMLAAMVAAPAWAAPAPVWMVDYQAALDRAVREQKPLLLHFSMNGCGPCMMMEAQTFPHPGVRQVVTTQFVAVKIQDEHYPGLANQYGVQKFPSDVWVDPTNGSIIDRHTGMLTADQYTQRCQGAASAFQRTLASRKPVERPRTDVAKSDQTPAVLGFEPSVVPDGDKDLPLGLEGFSPVSLSQAKEWKRGSSRYGWVYQEVMYYLRSSEELAAFRSAPERYAPKLLGCDPVVLWDTDRSIAGSPKYAAFYNDELYLFVSAESRQRFKASPERFVRTQHVVRPSSVIRQ